MRYTIPIFISMVFEVMCSYISSYFQITCVGNDVHSFYMSALIYEPYL